MPRPDSFDPRSRRDPAGPRPRDRRARAGRWALLAALLCGAPGAGQTGGPLSSEDRSFLERLALAKARADLFEQVYALPLGESATVGTWAARDLARDRALRLWLRSQPRHGAARVYADRTCDSDVRLEPETLRKQLEQLAAERPAAGPAEAALARELRRAAEKFSILWGCGTAALEEKSHSRKPEGWEDVIAEGLAYTRRAAEADARHVLLDTAASLPVTNARRLHEFLDSADEVRAAVLAALERSATVKVSFELDQVAVAEARIGRIDLIRILTDVHREHYRGDLFHPADFREMALLVPQEFISATGLASAPRHMMLRARYRPIEPDAPGWAGETLSVLGRYEPREEERLGDEARREAARLDGVDRLRQQVEALVIQKDVTVAAFLGWHDELKDDVILFLSGTRAVAAPRMLPNNVVEVPVELPLRRLWWIVRRGMQRIDIDPEQAATQPGGKDQP